MTTFSLDGLIIDSVTEENDAIEVVLAPRSGSFPSGYLDSNFQALTGFTEDAETGLITPVFETVTLTFNGY